MDRIQRLQAAADVVNAAKLIGEGWRQRAAARFGRHAMEPGKVYVQKLSDENLWFLAMDKNKNGGARGIQVEESGGRAKKAKTTNIPLVGADMYRPVAKEDVPSKVIERFEERGGKIS